MKKEFGIFFFYLVFETNENALVFNTQQSFCVCTIGKSQRQKQSPVERIHLVTRFFFFFDSHQIDA